jgi:hypothetical protein
MAPNLASSSTSLQTEQTEIANILKNAEIDLDDLILNANASLEEINKTLVTLLLNKEAMTEPQKNRISYFDNLVQGELKRGRALYAEIMRNHKGRADLFR